MRSALMREFAHIFLSMVPITLAIFYLWRLSNLYFSNDLGGGSHKDHNNPKDLLV